MGRQDSIDTQKEIFGKVQSLMAFLDATDNKVKRENLEEWKDLMWAYPERGNKSWIHLSYKEGQNRKITTLASERENIHNEYGGERRGNRKEFQEGIKTANQDIV